MVLTKYSLLPAHLYLLKIFLVVISLVVGIVLGRQCLHHYLLRDKCGLRMFTKDNGTFLTMPIMAAVMVYLASLGYNAMLPDKYLASGTITSYMGISNRTFGKVAQCGTWLGDLTTLVMVWDGMLQDGVVYPSWLRGCKRCWNERRGGKVRVIVVWVVSLVSTAVLFSLIFYAGRGGLEWSNYQGVLQTNEVDRICIVVGIILVDLLFYRLLQPCSSL